MDNKYYVEYLNLNTMQINEIENLTLDAANEIFDMYESSTNTIWIFYADGSRRILMRSKILSMREFKQERLKKYIKKL